MRAVRRALGLGVLLALALQPLAARAQTTQVTLRYHFVAGQTISYFVTTTESTRLLTDGTLNNYLVEKISFQAHYRVQSVAADGSASLSIVFDHQHAVTSQYGKTSSSTPDPASFSTPTDRCHQQADGTQFCSYWGAYSINDLGQVPHGPVAVGQQWQSRIDNSYGSPGSGQVTMHNQLTGLVGAASGPVADIESSASLSGPLRFISGSDNTMVDGRVAVHGHWRFDVQNGRFLGEDLSQAVTYMASASRDVSGQPMVRTVTVTSMQLISW